MLINASSAEPFYYNTRGILLYWCRRDGEFIYQMAAAAESGGMHVKYARDEWAPAGPRGTHVDTGLVCLLFVYFVPPVYMNASPGEFYPLDSLGARKGIRLSRSIFERK